MWLREEQLPLDEDARLIRRRRARPGDAGLDRRGRREVARPREHPDGRAQGRRQAAGQAGAFARAGRRWSWPPRCGSLRRAGPARLAPGAAAAGSELLGRPGRRPAGVSCACGPAASPTLGACGLRSSFADGRVRGCVRLWALYAAPGVRALCGSDHSPPESRRAPAHARRSPPSSNPLDARAREDRRRAIAAIF